MMSSWSCIVDWYYTSLVPRLLPFPYKGIVAPPL